MNDYTITNCNQNSYLSVTMETDLFSQIPKEMKLKIFEKICIYDMGNLLQTNKKWYNNLYNYFIEARNSAKRGTDVLLFWQFLQDVIPNTGQRIHMDFHGLTTKSKADKVVTDFNAWNKNRRIIHENSLDLSNRSIKILIPQISILQRLEKLNLNNNNLTNLPTEIGLITTLTELHLHSNNFDEVPPQIFKLFNLKQLNLGNNKLTNLPPDIKLLKNLTHLYINHNYIRSLPQEIYKLRNLQSLNVADNGCFPLRSIKVPNEFWDSRLSRLTSGVDTSSQKIKKVAILIFAICAIAGIIYAIFHVPAPHKTTENFAYSTNAFWFRHNSYLLQKDCYNPGGCSLWDKLLGCIAETTCETNVISSCWSGDNPNCPHIYGGYDLQHPKPWSGKF